MAYVARPIAGNDTPGYKWRPDRQDAGRRILMLARGDPEAALPILRATVGALGGDLPAGPAAGRQEMVCALGEIARAPENFEEAARLLLRLAATDGSSAPNSAKETFARLFANVPGSMASTRAGAGMRAALLSELLDSGDNQTRLLALHACGMALTARNFMQVDCESGQPAMHLEWRIASGEFDAYKVSLAALTKRLDRMPPDERRKAVEIILERAVDLSRHEEVSCEVADAVRILHEGHLVGRDRLVQTTEMIVDACACKAGKKATAAWKSLLADASAVAGHAASGGLGQAAAPRKRVARPAGAGDGVPASRRPLPPAGASEPDGDTDGLPATGGGPCHDVFLSYSHEIKDSVAWPLARGLEKRGVSVWWDHDGVRIGDKLPGKIRGGLNGARYGVVAVSRGYLNSGWGRTELGAMFGKGTTIFPVLCGVAAEEAEEQLPALSGTLMRHWDGSSESVIDEIANAIEEGRGDRAGGPNGSIAPAPEGPLPQGCGGPPDAVTARTPAKARPRTGGAPGPPPSRGAGFDEIGGMIFGMSPSWMPGHLDHFHAVPGTDSYVFYPYDFSLEDEERLSSLCSIHGYDVAKRPKEESEYHPDSHKILILEPGYDDERVEFGCGLIAKWWRIYHARGRAGQVP